MKSHTLERVINATGIVLHAELAQLSSRRTPVASYSNEDLSSFTGNFCSRNDEYLKTVHAFLGVPGIAINNESAALFLVLQELASGADVIISRTELASLEELDRFRSIISRSGARLIEIGSDRSTTIQDYEAAMTPQTRLILRFHPSNSVHAEIPSLSEVVVLAKKSGIPVYEALGNGCWVDFSQYGLKESLILDSLKTGVDVISFSCDQLFGGPQASLIAGKSELIQRIRKNPLYSAFQSPVFVINALDSVIEQYRNHLADEIPTVWMIQRNSNEIKARAIDFTEGIDAEIAAGESYIGNGHIPTWLVILRGDAQEWDGYLRRNHPSILIRTENNQAAIDLRTVFPEEEIFLRKIIQARD